MMKALGFIETFGLLPAIEAADAMLKAADVRLVEKSLASGGLVTITVTGEVAAVKAAVDAGSAAVGRIQGARLVSRHVIARPDAELEKIIPEKKAAKKAVKKETATISDADTGEAPAREHSEQSAPTVKTADKKNNSTRKKR